MLRRCRWALLAVALALGVGAPLAVPSAAANATDPLCAEDLPRPQLVLVEERVPAGRGLARRRWRLEVANWEAYPAELLAAEPGLAPCRDGAGQSRLRLALHADGGEELWQSCALGSRSELRSLRRFGAEADKHGRERYPRAVYLELSDRRCRRKATSERLSLDAPRSASARPEPLPAPPAEPPIPVLFAHVEPGRDRAAARPWIEVLNWWQFRPELFAPAPHLEPCRDRPGARAWLEIATAEGEPVGTLCDLAAPELLAGFWFAMPAGRELPQAIVVTLRDRETGQELRSAPARLR